MQKRTQKNTTVQKTNILTFFTKKDEISFSSKKEFIDEKYKKSEEKVVASVQPSVQLESETIKKLKEELALEKKKNQRLENDLKKAKILITSSSKINLQKDVEISRLKAAVSAVPVIVDKRKDEEILHLSGEPVNILSGTKGANVLNETAVNKDKSPSIVQGNFKSFAYLFTSEEFEKVKTIRNGVPKDYTFIRTVLKYLYKDTNILLNRSATGKKYKNNIKQAISPVKKDILIGMFSERILNEGENSKDRLSRLDYLINQAIQNIKKNQKNTSYVIANKSSPVSSTYDL